MEIQRSSACSASDAFPDKAAREMAAPASPDGDFVVEPLRFLAAMGVLEEQVHVDEAGTGDDPFVADVSEAREQVTQELDFQFVAGSKIAMAAFAGEHLVLVPVPEEAGFAEAGSGRYYGLVADGSFFDLVQSDGVGIFQALDAPCLGFEIVDQIDRGQLKFLRQA